MKEDLVLIEDFLRIFTDRSYLVYDCKMGSFQFTGSKISTWKSTGILEILEETCLI